MKYVSVLTAVAVLLVVAIAANFAPTSFSVSRLGSAQADDLQNSLFPSEGFKTKIVLGNIIPKLVESGAIDLDALKEIYGDRLTKEQLDLLTKPSNQPLTITNENANFLLTVLWPLGIANKNPILDEMEQYEGVANLASTGGWTLAKGDPMNYFNKLELVKLTPEQQKIVKRVADNAYRPCCNNPTSFADCNHGAALLALLEIGASQGMNEDELYRLALEANTFWFPQQYLSTAVLFEMQGKDYWNSAKEIMGKKYSSVSGWMNNVYKPLQDQDKLPQAEGGGSCGV